MEMLPMIKMLQKYYCFFSFFKDLCVQQYPRSTVNNDNIDQEGPGSLNLIFANQFKWAPYNNIDPGGPGPSSLIFSNLNGPQ